MAALVQPSPPDVRWSIELGEFQVLLASKRESAPGADGLPSSVYSSAGGIGAKVLFAAYQACLQGTALPAGFGASRTVFNPTLRAMLSVRLKPYALSRFATVIAK